MATPAAAPNLTCKECGYNNEPERVYCHNCGAKLDRSVLPKEEQLRRESPERARKRLIRMTNPGSSPLKDALISLAKTLAYAVCVAAIICMALPPEDVPPAKGMSMRMVSSDLLELANSAQPRSASFSQQEINAFLGSAKSKATGLVPGVEYKRSFVNLSPGVAHISLERSFWGFSMYFGTIYRVEGNSGVVTTTNVGGNVGRLPVSPLVMEYLQRFLLKDIRETFKTEIGQLKQMAYLRVEKERLQLASAGKR